MLYILFANIASIGGNLFENMNQNTKNIYFTKNRKYGKILKVRFYISLSWVEIGNTDFICIKLQFQMDSQINCHTCAQIMKYAQ